MRSTTSARLDICRSASKAARFIYAWERAAIIADAVAAMSEPFALKRMGKMSFKKTLLALVRFLRTGPRTAHCHVANGVIDVSSLEASAPSLRTCSEGCSHPSLCSKAQRVNRRPPSSLEKDRSKPDQQGSDD